MVRLMPGDTKMTDNEILGLQTQITSLGTRMEKGFDELKEIVSGFDQRVRTVELKEANCNPILTARVDSAWLKLNEHEASIKELVKISTELVYTNRILKWLLGIFTVIMGAFLIKLAGL